MGEAPTLTDEPATLPAADAELADVALAASGDGSAFERLYRSHKNRVHGLARRMLDADVADDVTQDVFVRAWEKLHTFRAEAQFGTWLHRLAVNVILNWRRSEASGRRHTEDRAEVDAVPGARAGGEGEVLDLESAIAKLPPGAREVFVLHDVQGFRHEEIATMTGVTTGTSKAQLHRARMLLRAHLER